MSAPVQPRFARVAAAIGEPTRALMLSRLLADADVAHALEALLRVADGALPETTRWQTSAMRGLRHARSCYGHLAGELGVRLCDSLVQQGWVIAADGEGRNFALTPAGVAGLTRLGVPPAAIERAIGTGNAGEGSVVASNAVKGGAGRRTARRQLYGCVDWSERRDHFAGPLAVTLLDTLVKQDWLRRTPDSRELMVTAIGRQKMDGLFGAPEAAAAMVAN